MQQALEVCDHALAHSTPQPALGESEPIRTIIGPLMVGGAEEEEEDEAVEVREDEG